MDTPEFLTAEAVLWSGALVGLVCSFVSFAVDVPGIQHNIEFHLGLIAAVVCAFAGFFVSTYRA